MLMGFFGLGPVALAAVPPCGIGQKQTKKFSSDGPWSALRCVQCWQTLLFAR